MRIFNAIATKDHIGSDIKGNKFTLTQGKEYKIRVSSTSECIVETDQGWAFMEYFELPDYFNL